MDVAIKIIFLSSFLVHTDGVKLDTVHELVQILFSGYDPLVRPPTKYNKTVTPIYVTVSLLKLLDVNELQRTLSTELAINEMYEDSRLKWDASLFENLHEIYMEKEKVWDPEIKIINSITSSGHSYSTPIRILNSGTVVKYDHFTTTTFCDINVEFFPFDTQLCYCRIRLWHLDDSQAIIKPLLKNILHDQDKTTGDTSDWIIKNVTTVYGLNHSYHPAEGQHSMMIIEICLKRKRANYVLYVLLPCGLVAFLVTLGFLLPANSGEKVTYNLMILLAYSVFQTLSTKVPMTSFNIPKMTYLINGSKIYASVATVVSVFILRIYHHGKIAPKSPPPRVMKICRKYIRKLVHLPDIVTVEEHDEMNLKQGNIAGSDTKQQRIWNRAKTHLEVEGSLDQKDTHNLVKDLVDKHKRAERRMIRAREWDFLSLIISRVMFVVFLVVYLICCFRYWYIALYSKRPAYKNARYPCEY